jgi:hypothetical protein
MKLPITLPRLGALLALLGLSLLILQGLCSAYGFHLSAPLSSAVSLAHHGGAASAGCCTEVDSAAPQPSAKAMLGTAKPLSLAAALLVLVFVAPARVFLSRVAPLNAAPLPLRSYYARTARILR